MKISEASKIAGVSKRTLQYYDDEGLLSVKRMENNHRDYDLESLQIIWKILNLKEMGFELEEIRRLLVKDRISFDEKKEEIRKKIKDYQIQYKYIEYIIISLKIIEIHHFSFLFLFDQEVLVSSLQFFYVHFSNDL